METDLSEEAFAVYSRHVVLPGKGPENSGVVETAGIVIVKGRIEAVVRGEEAREEIRGKYGEIRVEDLGEWYVCPGLVDINCCFNSDVGSHSGEDSASSDSSYPHSASSAEDHWEDYATGTKAAAAGGVTTVIESPTLRYSNLLTSEAVERKVRTVQSEELYCDVGLLGYAGSGNLGEMEGMVRAGVMGFVGYMVPPCAHLGYFETEHDLKQAMSTLHPTNHVLLLHPERTTSRFLFMASPFRQHSREDLSDAASPQITCFAAAFPEDVDCGSCDSSPFVGTPMKASPVQSEDLEKCIKKHKENMENLVDVEMRSYGNSGDTYFTGSPCVKPSPPCLRPILTQSNKLSPPPRQAFRPPPISCHLDRRVTEYSDYSALLANSPPHWEVNGVSSILKCLEEVQCRVHIAALSSASTVCQVKKAKNDCENGNLLTCEVSIPHLYFSSMNIKNGDTRFKVNPLIRDPTNRGHLVELLRRGAVDCVCSAHRPVKPTLKCLQTGNFQKALSGISDMGVSLSALWTLLRPNSDPKAIFPLISQLMSTKPAEIVNLPSKGSIFPGKDADLVVFDPNAGLDMSVGHLHVKHPELSPFIGEKLYGVVRRTYVRGQVVYSGQEFRPLGRLLLPSSS